MIAAITLLTGFISWIAARTVILAIRRPSRPESRTDQRGDQPWPTTRPGNDLAIVTKLSPRPVTDTVARLTGMISAKGMRLFAVIDQQAEARQAGLDLRETTLVMFGSPAAGTPVMAAAPLAALDLPLKVLIWADEGQTKVSYYSPAATTRRPRSRPVIVSAPNWPATWPASTRSPTRWWRHSHLTDDASPAAAQTETMLLMASAGRT